MTGPDRPSPARAAAERYLDHVYHGRYDQIGSLMAEEAVFYNALGEEFHGRAAIHAWYADAGAARLELSKREGTRASMRAASWVEQGDDCVVELEWENAETGSFWLRASDHFTVDGEGKIVRLAIFNRAGA
jgi:hypothetical protein